MKYLLFNWNKIAETHIGNPDDLSNIKFKELAEKHGEIYLTDEAFQRGFNDQEFSTETHQLRIIN